MKRGIEHNTHPGEMLREDILEANGISISKASEMLGISRGVLSKIVNERAAITPSFALRLVSAFGGNAGFWLRLQLAYDLREAEKAFESNPPKIQKFQYA